MVRRFFIKRLQTIHGKERLVFIRRVIDIHNKHRFYPCDTLKLATIFDFEGIQEFKIKGALKNVDYTVIEIDHDGRNFREFTLNDF